MRGRAAGAAGAEGEEEGAADEEEEDEDAGVVEVEEDLVDDSSDGARELGGMERLEECLVSDGVERGREGAADVSLEASVSETKGSASALTSASVRAREMDSEWWGDQKKCG